MPGNARELSETEERMARDVFRNSLPSWGRIRISDALGYDDRPFTLNEMGLYFINAGPEVYEDAALAQDYKGFGARKAILIHEMTHVWQYYHGYSVELRSLWANSRGAGYAYTVGENWDDYNVEQQAHLVEDWFMGRQSETDPRFVYIDKIIRPGRPSFSAFEVARKALKLTVLNI
jgi:hypothetical protein